jgi:hypothetical protein
LINNDAAARRSRTPRPQTSTRTRKASIPKNLKPTRTPPKNKPKSSSPSGKPKLIKQFDCSKGIESRSQFRTQKMAVGKCTGQKLEEIKSAFGVAYKICAAAEREVSHISKLTADRQAFYWNSYNSRRESSLGYWFGETTPLKNIKYVLTEIIRTLKAWEKAFRKGFWGKQPVFVRCKTVNAVGNPPARHLVRNTIEICPPFFKQPSFVQRAITILHEMGHWLHGSATKPRDERCSICKAVGTERRTCATETRVRFSLRKQYFEEAIRETSLLNTTRVTTR